LFDVAKRGGVVKNLTLLKDVVLFGADTARSRAYFSLLVREGLAPVKCILIESSAGSRSAKKPVKTEYFDNVTPLAEQAKHAGVDVVVVQADDLNAPEVIAEVEKIRESVLIFSGLPGALVKDELFATGKKFLHVHPGRLPQYRGSTTVYYSLLKESKIWVSAILLDPQIDEGPVVGEMEAEVPSDKIELDTVFDPLIRARLMVEVLKGYEGDGEFQVRDQNNREEQTYFVIHPVLKHIALLTDQNDRD
jgi:methionyl-tRNA formyltransferase